MNCKALQRVVKAGITTQEFRGHLPDMLVISWRIALLQLQTTCSSSYSLVGAFEAYVYGRTGQGTVFICRPSNYEIHVCHIMHVQCHLKHITHYFYRIFYRTLSFNSLLFFFYCPYVFSSALSVNIASNHLPILKSICTVWNYYVLFCSTCAIEVTELHCKHFNAQLSLAYCTYGK